MNQLQAGTMLGPVYKVMRCIGKGSSASVYEVQDTFEVRDNLAAKVLPLDEKYDDAIENEWMMLKRLVHVDGVPHYYMLASNDNFRYMVISLHGMSLDVVQENHPKKTFTTKTLLTLLYSIVKVTRKIHNKHIIHRDIKPANIFLKFHPERQLIPIVLGDYGHSILLRNREDDEGDEIFEKCFYSTPTMMQKKQATRKSDLLMTYYSIIDLLNTDPFGENKTDDINEVRKKKEQMEECPESVLNETWLIESLKPLLATKDSECPNYTAIFKAIRGAKRGFDPKNHRLELLKGDKGEYLE